MSRAVIMANLDCEARWSGLALPRRVRERISLLGALTAVLAPDNVVPEVWTPVGFDCGRWRGRPATFAIGTPPHWNLAWADPTAKPANDRRLALAVAALPGARTIHAVSELPALPAWVAKLPWTAAGRDRVRGTGEPSGEQQRHLARLLAVCGELVVEPWCERVVDFGVCATVDRTGHVAIEPPHGLIVDRRGGFGGIVLGEPALTASERVQLDERVRAAGVAVAGVGYAGPIAVDGFVYRDDNLGRVLHAPCEINARYSFGWIARALARQTGATRLEFASEVASDGQLLIAPGDDGVAAWWR